MFFETKLVENMLCVVHREEVGELERVLQNALAKMILSELS